MVYNITFDIDQTLAFHKVNSLKQGNFIHEKGAILSEKSLLTHYIYPGAMELVKVLFCSDEFRVSFFSKGSEDRNTEFVRLFLDRAIDEPEWEMKKSEVRVLSREDLTYDDCERCKAKQLKKYGLPAGYTPKDLYKVLSGSDRIENAALIDDRSENAVYDQVPNFIQMPLVENYDYDALINKRAFYDESGERYLKCMINFTKDTDLEQNVVEDGRRIIIYKTDDSYEIKFIDLDNVCHIEKVGKNSALLAKLNDYYEAHLADEDFLIDLEDQEIVKEVCNFVSEFNGRSKKICRRANRICYVTGLLFAAISHAKESKISLKESLFQYQFTLNEDEKTYRSNFCNLVKEDRFYWLGLKKLKEVNPDFEFVTPHSYFAYIQRPLSDEKRLFLQKAKDNEFDL